MLVNWIQTLQNPKNESMIRVLYFLSKTDAGIIRHCPSSTKTIHATLGFFVLMTGLLAFVSGTYAISNMCIHENKDTLQPEMAPYGWLFSAMLGLIYATFIMAIDREIVSSGTKWAAIFRLPLAIIISMIVSVPIELKIFEGRIIKQLRTNQQNEDDRLNAKTEKDNRIAVLEDDKRNMETLRQGAIEKRDDWSAAMEGETVGRVMDGRTGKAGQGPAYEEALRNKQLQEDMISRYDSIIKVKEEELRLARQSQQETFIRDRSAQSYDLLSRHIALKQVKDEDKTGSASAMGLGVIILFCLFELIPSIMKILIPPTEYDAILDNRRKLNILTANLIYQKTKSEYAGMDVDEIVEYNPAVIGKIYQAQAH